MPIIAFACGGDSNNKTIHTTDAKVFKDGPPAVCTATSTYGAVTLGSNDQDERSYKSFPNGSNSTAPRETAVGVLNADMLPDILFLDLYPGYGAFAPKGPTEQLKTGTFSITGDELDEATCGICPLIGTDFGSAGETDDYYAVDGSVTITSFGSNNGSNVGSGWSGTLAGSISAMHFQHVLFSMTGMSPAGDGCTTSIDSMSFSGTLVQETAAFQNQVETQPAHYRLALTNRRFQ